MFKIKNLIIAVAFSLMLAAFVPIAAQGGPSAKCPVAI